MKNKDALKKHHFWILAGVVPLMVMIAAVTISSNVGAAVEKKLADYETAKKSLQGKENPKPDELIRKIEQQVAKVNDAKLNLWEINWKRQKDMYVWPKGSALLKDIEKMNLKFGDKIPNDRAQYDEFKKPEVYQAEFSTVYPNKKGSLPTTGMADTLAPTQFKDNWQSVLRHVNAWDERQLTSEQIWLMMEDIWIQRSMLEAIRSVNAQMAEFRRVKYEKDGTVIDDPDKKTVEDPKRRKFHSRIWDVELEIVEKNGKQSLTGRLINHTDRLQLMGLNNTMILKVWLKPGKDVPPFEFKIGGEFLAGRGAMKADGKTPANVLNITPTDDHIISGNDAIEIVKVEQVFDTRTVPVRRIEAMELGKTDSRFADKQMQIPLFPAYQKELEKATATPDPKGAPGTGPGPINPGGPFGPGPIGPGGSGVGGQKSGGGTVDAVLNGNKKRYVEVTPGVRRMPVAIAVVVDQAYMQDVLLAFANSQLKFQITQVNWNRFRGTLGGTGTPGSNDSPINPLQPIFVGGGNGGGLGSEFGPIGPRPGPIGPGPIGPGPIGPGQNPFGPAGTLNTVSESQLTSGLIELSVYGVVSLYEKYPPPDMAKDTKTDPTPKVDPNPKVDPKKDTKVGDPKKEPMTDPKEKEPKDTKEPAMPETKGAKMRRRVR